MKHALWIVIGLAIAIAAWIPLNIDPDPRDIPVGAVILGVIGTLIGCIIVLVALIRLARQGASRA